MYICHYIISHSTLSHLLWALTICAAFGIRKFLLGELYVNSDLFLHSTFSQELQVDLSRFIESDSRHQSESKIAKIFLGGLAAVFRSN